MRKDNYLLQEAAHREDIAESQGYAPIGYADKHLIDVTDPQEPVYDNPMQRVEDYEAFIDGLQPSTNETNGER